MAKFSKGEAIKFGWKVAKENLGFFVVLLLIGFLPQVIPNILGRTFTWGRDFTFIALIYNLIFITLAIIIQLGYIKVALRFADGQKAELAELFRSSPLILKYLAGAIIYHVIVLIGLLLLIVPGIIWAIKFGFFSYFVVEGAGPIEALKKSSQITQGAKWDLFLFYILIGLVNVLGFLALIVGLFVTIPATMVATAYVFRKLQAAS